MLAEAWAQPLMPVFPVLLKYPDRGCAVEPDACYYLHTQPLHPLQHELELPIDPVPDLLVEVALTKSSLNKLPIYADLEIPEVWRYVTTAGEEVLKGKLLIYQLQGGGYREVQNSGLLPWLPAGRVLEFLEQSDSLSLATAIKLLKAWAQEQDGR